MFKATRAAVAAGAALVTLVAAGCGSTSHQNASASRPATSRAAAWHRVVLCARAHGMPNLADPTIDAQGNAHFPSGTKDSVPLETRRACQALFNRLLPNEAQGPPTQAQIASLVKFARCMRSHGVPDWPDPLPSGEFPLPDRLARVLKSEFRSQLMACDRFNPDIKGQIHARRP